MKSLWRVPVLRIMIILAAVETFFYVWRSPQSFEFFLGIWIFVYFALMLYSFIRIETKVYTAGSVDHGFVIRAQEMFSSIFIKPEHGKLLTDNAFVKATLILLGAHILGYIVLYVVV